MQENNQNKLLFHANGLVAKWKNKRMLTIKQDDGNIRVVLKRLATEKDSIELYNQGAFSYVVENKIIITQFVLSPEAFEALNHAYKYITSGFFKEVELKSKEKL